MSHSVCSSAPRSAPTVAVGRALQTLPSRTLAHRRLSTQEFPTFDGLLTALELIMKTMGGKAAQDQLTQ
jgi:hypothetical protein